MTEERIKEIRKYWYVLLGFLKAQDNTNEITQVVDKMTIYFEGLK